MLVNVNHYENGKIETMIAKLNGNRTDIFQHRTGVYEIGHFNFSHLVHGTYEYEIL